jgi:4-hydroxy-tetrahydrodipicolinate reductase
MDALPAVISGVVSDVRRVAVTRVVDATTRRGPLQKKIGSGMTPGAFEALAQQGKIGHVGLVESVALIAHCIGWPLEAVTETLDPVVTQEAIRTEHVQVAPGQVAGLHQTAAGILDGRKAIEMDLTMLLNAPNPRDEILIEGTPPVRVIIRGGTAGDPATVAALLNAVPRVLDAPPGLLTAKELSLPRSVG